MSKSKKEKENPYQGKGSGQGESGLPGKKKPPAKETHEDEPGEISIGMPISAEEYRRLKEKAKEKGKEDEG